MRTVISVLATAVAAALAALLVPGITVSGTSTASKVLTLVVIAVLIGLVNALVRPVVKALSGCLIVLTFGLFLLVINALMLMLASWLAQQLGFGFHVDGFGAAFLGSIVISLVTGLVKKVQKDQAQPA